jgi:hypothetical protein
MSHPSPLETYRELIRMDSVRRGKDRGRDEERIMSWHTEVFDGASLAFHVLRIFCGLRVCPHRGWREWGNETGPTNGVRKISRDE